MPDIVFKIARPSDPPQILAAVGELLAALDWLHLGDAVPDVRSQMAHAEALAADHRAAPARLEQVRDTLVARLIADDIDPDTARAQMSSAELAARKDSLTFEMMRRAVSGAATELWHTVLDYGDNFALVLLRPVVDDAVATIASSAATLPPTVYDAATGLASPPKVRDAWTRLLAAQQRWDAAHAVADRLRRNGVLSCPSGVRVTAAPAPAIDPLNPIVFKHKHPARLTTAPTGRHPALVLADDIAAGSEPGLWTGPDVDIAQLEREYAEAQAVAVP